MKTLSNADFAEVRRLLTYFLTQGKTCDRTLRGVNARRRAKVLLRRWSKRES